MEGVILSGACSRPGVAYSEAAMMHGPALTLMCCRERGTCEEGLDQMPLSPCCAPASDVPTFKALSQQWLQGQLLQSA